MTPSKRVRTGDFVARWWPALSWLGVCGATEITLKAVGLW